MTKAEEFTVKYKTLLDKNGINTPLRLAAFFGQLKHESNLEPKEENLNYTAKRLLEVFPKYFKDIKEATLYYGKPQKIANRVYANRMGNGDEASGDGYKYRGRFFIQTTGKDNYKELQRATGIDFSDNPDKHLNEADSLIAALFFWNKNKLNNYADKEDYKTMTKIINGGYNGLQQRVDEINHYKTIFK